MYIQILITFVVSFFIVKKSKLGIKKISVCKLEININSTLFCWKKELPFGYNFEHLVFCRQRMNDCLGTVFKILYLVLQKRMAVWAQF